jgi:hypothetical protein
MNWKVTFAVRATAVTSVVLAGVVPLPSLGLVPLFLVGLYAWLALREGRTAPGLLEARAEDVYFVGYISTLASFAGILLIVMNARGVPDDPSALVSMVVIALLATVAGLLAMASLKDVAAHRRRQSGASDKPWEDEVLGLLRRLIELAGLSPATTGTDDGPESSRALANASDKTTQIVEKLNTQLTTLEKNLGLVSDRTKGSAEDIKTFERSVKELQQTLDLFVLLVKKLVPDATRETTRIQ